MQEEIAKLVYPVLLRGLRLKERLGSGEVLDFDAEQAALRSLLLTDLEARRWTEYGGEGESIQARDSESAIEPFKGIRYALTCWLDEIFILDSSWESRWNEYKLEVGLYASNDRAWRFWQQANLAEKRPGGDALETFFLCVVLGFHGERVQEPAKLVAWTSAARAQITRGQGQPWAAPPELEPSTNVAPLRGRQKLQRALLIGGALLLVLLPLVALFVVQQLG